MKDKQKKILIIALAVIGQVALSVVCGAIAGSIAAGKVTDQFRVTMKTDLSLGSATGTGVQDIDDPQTATTSIKLISLSDAQLNPIVVPDSILDRRSPVATLLNAKKIIAATGLSEAAEIGRAAAVTSDGWFVTPAAILQDIRSEDVVVYYENQRYKAEKVILDNATQAAFIYTGLKGLPAVSFAQHHGQRSGIALWFESQNKRFSPSSLISVRKEVYPSIKSSDVLMRRMVAEGEASDMEMGAPLWDSKGSLVALAESYDGDEIYAIPGSAISASLQSLVSNGEEIKHASLGVYTLDLNFSEIEPGGGWPERGAKIYPTAKLKTGIEAGSAAENAKLQLNDVILQIDRDIMDGSLDLGDIVMQFRPGANVNLRIWRQGEEFDVAVELGTQVTSKKMP
ncbi:MAG: PDZ domain-containing protein [Patescibacteria group bacterium]